MGSGLLLTHVAKNLRENGEIVGVAARSDVLDYSTLDNTYLRHATFNLSPMEFEHCDTLNVDA